MPRIAWKNRQPASLRQGMEWCLEFAREKHNRSVERVADLMGLNSKWQLYKWMENGRLPSILIRPFEVACGIDFVTKYIGHSAHKLLINIPSGKKATGKDINSLQSSFITTVDLLLKFYESKADTQETLAGIYDSLEELAWHQGMVERHKQPDFDFEEISE